MKVAAATRRPRGARRRRGGRNMLFLIALSACAVGVGGANITCSNTRTGIWTCPAASVYDLTNTPPQKWYTQGTARKFMYAKPWINKEGFCCKHCVWDLGYPLVDPMVLVSDRTATPSPKHLNCLQWSDDFDALDTNGNKKLSLVEMTPWFTSGINKYITEKKRLNHGFAFSTTDLDLDGAVSREEWYVLRHFWAPVAVTRNGPLPSESHTNMEDGPLGGLFWDENLIEVFMADANNILMEQTSKSKQRVCATSVECDWDSSYVRESNEREQNRIMRTFDIDGSERVSLEEHYFRHFADRNNDGVISPSEYGFSLYSQVDGAFVAADLNQDGEMSFLERKFILADKSPKDNRLDKAEWVRADLPSYFGPFEGHKEGESVNQQNFNWYTVLHTCALEGVQVYQVSLSEYPWSPTCNIIVHAQANEPWIKKGATTNSRRAEAAVSAAGSSYLLDMFNEAVLQLHWNTSLTYVQDKSTGLDYSMGQLKMPSQLGKGYGTVHVGLFSDWQPPPSSDYVCTHSFAPELDGLSVVVRSAMEEISLTKAVLLMIVSPVFVNFSCFLFIVLIVIGHVYWFLEKNENSEQFSPSYPRGIVDSAWFCIVTMATVGYGDKVPASGAGKAITVFWMLFGILNFGIFTGQITSEINVQSAESAIAGVDDLGGFHVGVFMSTAWIKLDQQFQFKEVQCADMAQCSKLLLDKKVSALLVPTANVLTYFVKEKLASQSCGNPMRIVGDSVMADQYPAVRMCSYSKSVYAAVYLRNAIDKTMMSLEASGFASRLREVLREQVSDASAADSCKPALEYQLDVIIPAAATIFVYWIIIAYINHRKRAAQGRAIRSFFGQTQKTPEQLALYYGLKWKANARKFADMRVKGREVMYHAYKPALSHDDRLLNFLKRVRVLSSGHTHDLQRCQRDVNAVSQAVDAATFSMLITLAVLLGLLGGVIFSLWEVTHAQPRYMHLSK